MPLATNTKFINIYLNYLRKSYLTLLIIVGLLVAGGVYLTLTTITVESVNYSKVFPQHELNENNFPYNNLTGVNRSSNDQYFLIKITSKLEQSVLLNVVSSQKPIQLFNQHGLIPLEFSYPETRTTHRDTTLGDIYQTTVKSGTNIFLAQLNITGQPVNLSINKKFTYLDYLILLITIILPITLIASQIFYWLIQQSQWQYSLIQQSKSLFNADYNNKLATWLKSIPMALALLVIAIIVKVIYFIQMGHITFQHDYHGHIEYIQFYAANFTIPLPHKGWEYPQQPLYYMLAGSVYYFVSELGFSEKNCLWVIGSLTVLLSSIALIYAYRLIKTLTSSTYVHAVTIGFLGLTPSLIYMSTRISNDPLTASLAIISLFYIIKSYQTQFRCYFAKALLFTSLVFLSKISSLGLEILFFILLVISARSYPVDTKRKLYWFAIVGAAILSFTLYKAYYPAAGSFHFVNSGIWGGQDLRPLDVAYFFSFNFAELLNEGQALIGDKGVPAINASFPTYQYGTMLFGEFGYDFWRNQNAWVLPLQQLIIVLGLIVPIGWIAYGLVVKKNLFDKLFIVVTLISFVLVLKFVFQYPSMSNTDFRYYAAIFFFIAYFFATGINEVKNKYPKIETLITTIITLLFVSETAFILAMCRV